MPLNEDEQQALDLALNLMEQNSKFTSKLTNSLMDSYKWEAALARAELHLARQQVDALYASGFIPTEAAVFKALYPDKADVEALAKRETNNAEGFVRPNSMSRVAFSRDELI